METKKMTLTEAQELVKNTKYIVFNEDESEQIQKKLFEIGCGWFALGKEIQTSIGPFLYVNEKMEMTMSDKDHYLYFEKSKEIYMPTNSILNIVLEQPKPKFDPKTLQPFDKVLVRDEEHNIWKGDLFSYLNKEGDYKFICLASLGYKKCIPYNEETKHLVGTKEDAPEFYQLD